MTLSKDKQEINRTNHKEKISPTLSLKLESSVYQIDTMKRLKKNWQESRGLYNAYEKGLAFTIKINIKNMLSILNTIVNC